MKPFRVFYLFRGASRSTVVRAPDARTAEATWRHHHRGGEIERVEPMEETPPASPPCARPRPVRYVMLSEAEQERLAAEARRLTAELRAHINALP